MTPATNFDFLTGNWVIANRRLKDYKGPEWDEFAGSAKVWPAMDGMASIEELRGASGKLLGMGVRVLHQQTGLWADHWTSAAYGVINPPMMGSFKDGVAIFESEDVDTDNKSIKVRGIWDQITDKSCRWQQLTSRDAGANWIPNWIMNWTRVSESP